MGSAEQDGWRALTILWNQAAPTTPALLMSLSLIIVAVNAVLLKRVERDLGEPGAGQPARPLAPETASR